MPSEERIQCQVLSYFSVTLSFSRLISSAEKRYFVTLLMIFCSVPTEPGASARHFLQSHCSPGLPWPQCVKEPQTGLSHQTASPISQPGAKVSIHAPVGIYMPFKGRMNYTVVYRISSRESLLLLSSLAFKLIKLPTKYSLNFKASC